MLLTAYLEMLRIGYRSYIITIIKELSGNASAASKYLISLYDLLPTYSFLLPFPLKMATLTT